VKGRAAVVSSIVGRWEVVGGEYWDRQNGGVTNSDVSFLDVKLTVKMGGRRPTVMPAAGVDDSRRYLLLI